MRDDVTAVIPCCGRLEHFKQMWPTICGQMRCVIVAWTDTNTADWALRQDILWRGCRVVSVQGEEWFNLSRARNLGATLVTTPWLMFIDCDMLLSTDFAARLPLTRENQFVIFQGRGCGYAGFIAVHGAMFRRIGGYNTCLEGYGYEDTDLRERLYAANCGALEIGHELATHIEHGNDLRTMNYRNKVIGETNARNTDVAKDMQRCEHP